MCSHFLLTQTMYVIIAVVVTDTINVTTHANAATAPVDKESDSDPSDPACSYMNCTYVIIQLHMHCINTY